VGAKTFYLGAVEACSVVVGAGPDQNFLNNLELACLELVL